MPFDEHLAVRLRNLLPARRFTERRMFGGLCFLVDGHMTCGLAADTLMLRVGPTAYPSLVTRPHARPMTFTGRPLAGFLYLDPPAYTTDRALSTWLTHALRFVETLPLRVAKPSRISPAKKPAAKRARSVKPPAKATRSRKSRAGSDSRSRRSSAD